MDFEEIRNARRRNPSRVRIIKNLPKDSPDNYFHVDLEPGTILTVCLGHTYGAIDFTQGIAATLSEDPYQTPFGQLNFEYFEDVD